MRIRRSTLVLLLSLLTWQQADGLQTPSRPAPFLQHAQSIAQHAPSLHPQIEAYCPQENGAELCDLQGQLFARTSPYIQDEDDTLRLALEVAYLAHLGQRRRSGDSFITHPCEVAAILADARLDLASVVSGLLHDTVEDTSLTFEAVERLFGEDVRRIVEGETKVSKLPKMVRSELARPVSVATAVKAPSSKQDEQAENLRSMFVAMAEDWRIVVVKLADRLHNMRTLEYMPPHKRISIARETLEIFAPLAHRLGMWSFRSELADLSLKFLFPSEFAELEHYIDGKMLEYEATLEAATTELEDRLSNDRRLSNGFTITGRTKNVHSTWKKLQRRSCGVGEVLDLVALRIVIDADEEEDEASICYHVLGKVHSLWTPLPTTLKDYISSPKPNGYRSLHTTVLVGTQPLEVQIRTQTMHQVAEFGAAAHWAYAEGRVRGGDRRAWLQSSSQSQTFSRSISKWGEDVECAHEFMQLVRQDLLGTRVFVFTEAKGSTRILNLAKGATVSDCMLMLNASLVTHVPLVSGSAAALETELSNGEIVSFIERETPLEQPTQEAEQQLERLLFGASGAGVGAGAVGAGVGVGAVGVGGRSSYNNLLDQDGDATRDPGSYEELFDARPKRWRVCERCLPLPGDAVCCMIASQREGTLHRTNCECLDLRREVAAGGRLIRPAPALMEQYDEKLASLVKKVAPLAEGGREVLTTKIIVFTSDRPGLLLTVSSVVTAETLNIVDVVSKTEEVGTRSAFQYKVLISDGEMLSRLISELEALDEVVCVLRADMENMMHDLGKEGFWEYARPS